MVDLRVKRPVGFTLVAVLLLALSLAALYFSFGFFTGREGKRDVWMAMREQEQPAPVLPVWPFTIPASYEPLPALAILSLAFGLAGVAVATALWRVSRWGFILCLVWSAAGVALGIGQVSVELCSRWEGAVNLACFGAFALFLCSRVRQVLKAAARPTPSPYEERPW